jgi:hypothetical protein
MDDPAWRLTFVFAAAVAAILAGELFLVGAVAWCLARGSVVELPAIRAMTWHQSRRGQSRAPLAVLPCPAMLQSWWLQSRKYGAYQRGHSDVAVDSWPAWC